MRMLLTVTIPHESFNAAIRKGTIGATMARIMDDTKPEAVYFTENDGLRQVVLVIDVQKASQVPAFAEPWFLSFNADCRFRVVMSREDLDQAGLDALGKKWA